MKQFKVALTLLVLVILGWSGVTFADSCSISCPQPGSTVSCSISAAPGNTVICYFGGASDITCCEMDPYGAPVRDIHYFCPGSGGSGGGGCGRPCISFRD